MALEPEDLHLALDTGIGVVVSVAGQRPPVLGGEGEGAHDESTRCGSQIVPRPQFTAMRSHLQFVPGQAKPSITATPARLPKTSAGRPGRPATDRDGVGPGRRLESSDPDRI